MIEKIPEVPKQEVPQINPKNGISKDFVNQFAFLISLYDFGGLSRVVNQIKDRPFKARRYADVYANFRDVVNDKNRESVSRLDELMANLEEILQDHDNINEDAFRKTINEAYFTIYGNNEVEI